MDTVPRPRRFRIFAPDGTVEESVGWIHLGYIPPPKEACQLMFTNIGGTGKSLNRLVVVVNAEDQRIVYQPRRIPKLPPWTKEGFGFLTEEQSKWLKEHPHWPKVLELDLTEVDEDTWTWAD